MITCDLMGRLGNQLFQMAATICHAVSNGLDYCLPNATINERVWPKYVNVEPCCNGSAKNFRVYREKTHAYIDIGPLDNIQLHGFFQSEKYFRVCRDQILKLFGIKWNYKKGWVSIHVRRGDYVVHHDKHPPVTMDYLALAIEYMYTRGYVNFLVFSDDILYCQKEFGLIGAVFKDCIFEFSKGKSEIVDLEEMSGCEHNIIANSTFSWWAAWLNRNPKKIVIAPKIWFGPGNAHLDSKDIIPVEWIKL